MLIGGIALIGMKLFPLYNEKMKVDFALEKVAGTPGAARLSKREAIKQILKQFEVSDVDRFEPKTLSKVLKIEKKKHSTARIISMAYEIRGPLFGDLDVVLKYNNALELSGSGAAE
jgi:hypothetical protein